MAVRLTTSLVSQGISISNFRTTSHVNFSFASSSSTSCKLRHRNLSCSCLQKRPRARKKGSQGQSAAEFQPNGEEDSESEANSIPILSSESVADDDDDDVHIISSNDLLSSALTTTADQAAPSDVVGMIRNAEKNIILLNRARVSALQDLDKILSEKEELQGEMNALEMKLAETNARLKLAAQEKVKTELLGDHLNQLRNEQNNFNGGGGAERSNGVEIFKSESDLFNEEAPLPYKSSINALVSNLSLLRLENVSLRNDIQELREELNNVKNTDQRVVMLEGQRSSLESSLKELESKLTVSQEDVSKLSNLKVECKGLWEKVENLQVLLDKSTKQADQAITVLQQNQEIQKKVDKLQESLENAYVYKESSKKMQQYNELMQQKIKLMEDRLQRSDEEILAYVKLYQESV